MEENTKTDVTLQDWEAVEMDSCDSGYRLMANSCEYGSESR